MLTGLLSSASLMDERYWSRQFGIMSEYDVCDGFDVDEKRLSKSDGRMSWVDTVTCMHLHRSFFPARHVR